MTLAAVPPLQGAVAGDTKSVPTPGQKSGSPGRSLETKNSDNESEPFAMENDWPTVFQAHLPTPTEHNQKAKASKSTDPKNIPPSAGRGPQVAAASVGLAPLPVNLATGQPPLKQGTFSPDRSEAIPSASPPLSDTTPSTDPLASGLPENRRQWDDLSEAGVPGILTFQSPAGQRLTLPNRSDHSASDPTIWKDPALSLVTQSTTDQSRPAADARVGISHSTATGVADPAYASLTGLAEPPVSAPGLPSQPPYPMLTAAHGIASAPIIMSNHSRGTSSNQLNDVASATILTSQATNFDAVTPITVRGSSASHSSDVTKKSGPNLTKVNDSTTDSPVLLLGPLTVNFSPGNPDAVQNVVQSLPTSMIRQALDNGSFASPGVALVLQLDPPELGRVVVRIVAGDDRHIRLHFKVDDLAVQETLSESWSHLESSLKAHGLNPSGFSVDLNQASTNGDIFGQSGGNQPNLSGGQPNHSASLVQSVSKDDPLSDSLNGSLTQSRPSQHLVDYIL